MKQVLLHLVRFYLKNQSLRQRRHKSFQVGRKIASIFFPFATCPISLSFLFLPVLLVSDSPPLPFVPSYPSILHGNTSPADFYLSLRKKAIDRYNRKRAHYLWTCGICRMSTKYDVTSDIGQFEKYSYKKRAEAGGGKILFLEQV